MTADEEVEAKPNRLLGIRHVQAAMLFLAMMVSFSMRVNMSVGIVAMTDPSQQIYFDWNAKTQSMILSSFFWGYVLLQIPGGELAGRFGGKILITLSVAINSALCLIIPVGAIYGGWKAVCACRVGQGLSQGFLIPSTHSLIVSWAPREEKSRLGTFIYAGSHLGNALQLTASGFIADSWGWQGIFYTNGVIGSIWTVAYIMLGSNSPQDSKMISSKEKFYIQNSLGHIGGKKTLKTPWTNIWTSLPFISLIIIHCGESWGFWTLATQMPSYMSQVFGVNVRQNGMMSALPYLVSYLVSIPLGYASDYILKKDWLSLTVSRKLSNSIASFGPALALIGLTYVPTDEPMLAVTVLTLSVGLSAGIFTGFMLVHIDMAPNFAGALMGVTNCFSNTVALMAPLIAGVILKDQTDSNDWQKVFFLASAMYTVSNLIFLMFGTSEKQKWNDLEDTKDMEDVEQKINNGCHEPVPAIIDASEVDNKKIHI